ncbi:oligosaccharide flippase family protein [Bacteroides uniformis]|nr:oligosaccharide flippase family protein [Bacteroides uniformis]MDC1734995.1 oligosaccharide flippase family protein [Bacteroides uniformis]
MKYITFLNLLAKFFFTICIFLFVKDKDDYILQPLFVSLGFISSGFIALYIILFRWEIQLTRPVWTDIRKTIKDSTNVFINNLMPNMYNSMATILLGFFSSETMVGIYSSGKNFVSVSNTMLAIISRTFFPYLSRKENKHRIYAKISICITLIVVVALFVLAPFIIHLFYTEDFSDSIKVLRITSISLLFITLNNVYGTNYLLIHNCDKLLRNIVVVASLTGFLISFPLIYYWGYIGASLTFLFTSMMLGTLSTCFAIKVKRNQCK